jgi:SAM-dependent methyltransferase
MGTENYQRAYCEGFVAGTIAPVDSPHLRRQLDETLRAAELRPGDRVLEVGCGMGRFTLALASRGIAIEGLDFSPVLLERLRAFEGQRFNIPLHVADIDAPPASLDGQFDAVMAFFVLHHLPDLNRTMAAVARLLKPGGRAVFLDVNGWNPLFYLEIFLTPGMTWRGDKGFWNMRPGVLVPAMEAAGLQSVRAHRFGLFPAPVANTALGARVEARVEQLPVPWPLQAYQLFTARRTPARSVVEAFSR